MRSPNTNNFFRDISIKYYVYGIMAIIALISISNILKGSIFIVHPGERGLIINLGKLLTKDRMNKKLLINYKIFTTD